MGQSQGRESRGGSDQQGQQPTPSVLTRRHIGEAAGNLRRELSGEQNNGQLSSSGAGAQSSRTTAAGAAPPRRRSGHDISLFSSNGSDPSQPEARRETRAEREARKLEKERAQRLKDRERSIREESVDGGYMVTMGVYTGTEDYNKAVVRQLQIERRIAPFWRGLNDFDEMWTEYQLIAAARGLPIPAPDESPPEEIKEVTPTASKQEVSKTAMPIAGRSFSANSETSPTNAAFSLPSVSSPLGSPSSGPFFRGRAKTVAALSAPKSGEVDMTPKEVQLPRETHINGQPIEVFLYKEAAECPICFLYYPPYLNKTRCCDQPICAECFVQIKRPDPHPPEHADPTDPNNAQSPTAGGEQQPPPSDEYMLVSEPATCPFCKTPEFGVSYESPPFKTGLTYANAANGQPIAHFNSAMSSSSSLQSGAALGHSRRRTGSLGVNEPNVITTDRIRPDWAKKLSDARAHALRRAAAATALHNAAYVLGNQEATTRFGLGRRRRTFFGDSSTTSSGAELSGVGALLAAAERHSASGSRQTEGSSDLFPGRQSSRRNRIEDIEELMMMEAIRLSLAAEEERKKKEDKEVEKQKKKDEKQKAKEQKKAEKAAKKSGRTNSTSSSFMGGEPSSPSTIGKGKGVDRAGSIDSYTTHPQGASAPQSEPSTSLNTSPANPKEHPQAHLERSRAQFQAHNPTDTFANGSTSARQNPPRALSTASSSNASTLSSGPDSPHAASFVDASRSASGSHLDVGQHLHPHHQHDTPQPGSTPTTEPMFNFRSLAEVITVEDEQREGAVMVQQNFPLSGSGSGSGSSASSSRGGATVPQRSPVPTATTGNSITPATNRHSRHKSAGEIVFGTPSPPPEVETEAEIEHATAGQVAPTISNPYDAKHYGDIGVLEGGAGAFGFR